MNGINGELASVFFETFSDALHDLAETLVTKFGTRASKAAAVRSKISTAVQKQVDAISNELWGLTHSNFVKPIVEMVSVLPKDEMANLAESLVALTSLKRRVSRELETVGGPIDVAVISKSEGFVWIKRKHYFDLQLNHQFAAQYFDRRI